jgi:tripartite-type tricarboxylate transporter receptor subunit TctC
MIRMNLARVLLTLIGLIGLLEYCVAQDTWPSKPITYIVPYPAGGTTDILARLITQKLGLALGTTIIVVNKPGATGTIGSAFVAKSLPDGYTLLGTSTGPHAIYPALSTHPVYDAIEDFTPVILIGTIPSVMIVAGDSPFNSVMDIVNHARANPWKIKFASGGTGTILQMSGELLSLGTQTQMTHIPYKGDIPAIQDVMAGHVDFMFVPASPVLGHIKSGKLKALGTATAHRLPELPEVPTINEQGQKDFIAEQWQAIFLPPHTPLAIVERYNLEINKILNDPEIIERLNQLGVTKIGGSPKNLADYQKADITQWMRVGQAANISID